MVAKKLKMVSTKIIFATLNLSAQIYKYKYTNKNTQINKDTKTQQKIKGDLQNWILIAQMNCVAREANKIARKKSNCNL